jgi:predicted nucleic acid-binding protein
MARKPKAIVLDSWSVLAYFEDETAGEAVGEIIADAYENSINLLMSLVNVGEVWYIVARQTSEKEADACIDQLRQLGINFAEVDWKLVRQAARFKSKHKMSFADCFAAALAKEHSAQLVTGDKEFQSVTEEIKINWL